MQREWTMTRKTARIDEPVDITKKELMVEDMSTALLDTGAKPSVIDTGTLQELGLGHREQKRESQVFGLGKVHGYSFWAGRSRN